MRKITIWWKVINGKKCYPKAFDDREQIGQRTLSDVDEIEDGYFLTPAEYEQALREAWNAVEKTRWSLNVDTGDNPNPWDKMSFDDWLSQSKEK